MATLSVSPHSFHIPVMGLGFTLETPLKVAHLGIDSVMSIMDDGLLESLRRVWQEKYGSPYTEISEVATDSRAKRITAYLDTLQDLVQEKVARLRTNGQHFSRELEQYMDLLPDRSSLKAEFLALRAKGKAISQQQWQRWTAQLPVGSLDVNIMTKVDKPNFDKAGNPLGREYSDAMAALRGFAQSQLRSAVVFSAGLNPGLYSYCAQFPDFLPDAYGQLKKRIILKVSDYRSALIQGRFLAKKGLWVDEFRVESGLNCGGHAFATPGYLLGPILAEFKEKRAELAHTLRSTCEVAWEQLGLPALGQEYRLKLTAQGGVGTAAEHAWLLKTYALDRIGWGSPFLLVPEATQVDAATRQALTQAKPSDFYLSHASPLGVPFNNFRKSSGEQQRIARIEKNRPGSPCYKKFLSFDTSYTEKAICTASRQYQRLKLQALEATSKQALPPCGEKQDVLAKDCLCEGLGASALLEHGVTPPRGLSAVSICPGPNTTYFRSIYTLSELVGHIYGRNDVVKGVKRPHLFVKELSLYVDYWKKELAKSLRHTPEKIPASAETFRQNLLEGIHYYKALLTEGQMALTSEDRAALRTLESQLQSSRYALKAEMRVLRGENTRVIS